MAGRPFTLKKLVAVLVSANTVKSLSESASVARSMSAAASTVARVSASLSRSLAEASVSETAAWMQSESLSRQAAESQRAQEAATSVNTSESLAPSERIPGV